MTEKGYVSTTAEAFDKWLGVGREAYSSIQALTDTEAIDIIHKSGGIAFLAHPHLTKKSGNELESFIMYLKDGGLDGIEGYYTEYTARMHEEYCALAKKHSLKISGGTDFHGIYKPQIKIGCGYGNMQIPYEVLNNIKAL